jgi:two-component system, cell cycle sensor histidine kinase and response regulator CckA
VADDSADTREFLSTFLTSQGYRVVTAENGAEALELMREALPHALLLDLMMPILDGWNVLDECARHPDLRDVPVIAMSALSGVDERVRACGAVAFVSKPIEYNDLLVALRLFATPPASPAAREPVEPPPFSARIGTAIRESEHLYRTLMEQAWDGILLFGADLNCLWANVRAADLFGYDVEQLCQVNYRSLFGDDGEALADTPLSERSCRRHDGTVFIGEVSVKKIDWRRQVLVRDVTKAKQLEEECRQSQKMDAMGQLAGGIAHDFNNLLTVIIGLSEMAMDHVGPDHVATRDLRDIHTAAGRAAGLTQQLLAFSRKQVLDIHSVDVHVQIEQFTGLLRRILPENIELRVHLRASVTTIDADPTQVDQLLLNLAVNAKAAMPDGGVLTLSTENTTDANANAGRGVRIMIGDTGVGMDEQTQRRMFEPFFTTKPPGQGTGLGLAMVYGTVQQLGGTISVKSRVGKGTIFRLTFPCSNGSERTPSRGVRPPGEAAHKHGTLMIVEDEASVRAFVAKALEHMGYRVLSADGPLTALQIVREHPDAIDLIITDVMMPDMTGPVFVKEFHRTSPRSAVLYISGYMADPNSLGVGRSGFDYLPKPFTIEQLSTKVCALIEQSRHEHARARLSAHERHREPSR